MPAVDPQSEPAPATAVADAATPTPTPTDEASAAASTPGVAGAGSSGAGTPVTDGETLEDDDVVRASCRRAVGAVWSMMVSLAQGDGPVVKVPRGEAEVWAMVAAPESLSMRLRPPCRLCACVQKLGARVTIKELLQKDAEDESLRKYKASLMGAAASGESRSWTLRDHPMGLWRRHARETAASHHMTHVSVSYPVCVRARVMHAGWRVLLWRSTRQREGLLIARRFL